MVTIFDPISCKQVMFFRALRPLTCVVFSSDGKKIACGEKGHSPVISVWNVHSGDLIAQFSGHKIGVGSLAFSKDLQFLISAGFKHDKQLIIWSMSSLKAVALNKLTNKVNSISFSEDDSYFGLLNYLLSSLLSRITFNLKKINYRSDLRRSSFKMVVHH